MTMKSRIREADAGLNSLPDQTVALHLPSTLTPLPAGAMAPKQLIALSLSPSLFFWAAYLGGIQLPAKAVGLGIAFVFLIQKDSCRWLWPSLFLPPWLWACCRELELLS